jgi:hypothetical protein
MMMSGYILCESEEVWVFKNVLHHFHMPSVTVVPVDSTGTTVQLMFHAQTKQEGQRMQLILEATLATLRALHFMGQVHVAETLPETEKRTGNTPEEPRDGHIP